MADQNHLKILQQGVEVWNQWRKKYHEIIPDLRDVNLSGVCLRDANFSDADLREANLSGADLRRSNLNRTNLKSASLSGAKLRRAYLRDAKLRRAYLRDAILNAAILKRVQALKTNFEGATLTGACIEDWNINSQTNLKNVKCEYIYLKEIYSEEEKKGKFSDRRPHDPNKNFAPGEFTKLFQKALETVDLIFSEGIEWTAFLESFQQLQAEVKSEELAIQGIEKKSAGAFVVRLEVPREANKAEIEKYIRKEYDAKVKVIEANYQKQLQAKDETIQAYREKSIDMFELTKIIATNQPDINISVVSGDSYNTETAGIVHNEKGNISENAKVAGEINEDGQPK